MNLELFIAKRIYSSQQENDKGTPIVVRIATIGIALGLAVMILSLAIIIGFKKEVRAQAVGFGSHLTITNFSRNATYESTPIAVSDSLLEQLRMFPGINHASCYATKPGILKTESDFQGIIIKGVGADYDFSFFSKNLKQGELISYQEGKSSTDAVISQFLSSKLRLNVGDSFLTYFIGETVRARKFNITGIYETGFEEFDKSFILADIKQVQRLNDWDNDQASGIEMLIDDYDKLDETAEAMYFFLANQQDRNGNTFYSRTIKDINPMLFEWLAALDINVIIILILMISVAGFTMISGLLIIILEQTNMIGTLKALGANNRNIRKIFLYVSLFLIGKGMMWGNIIGLGICFLQAQFKILPLNPADYYIDAVPISLDLSSILVLNLASLFVIMTMMLAPSYFINKIEPVKTIKFE